jgi:hypothetical protein
VVRGVHGQKRLAPTYRATTGTKKPGFNDKKILTFYLLMITKLYGTGTVATVPEKDSKCILCTGVYEEMRELEGGPARTLTPEEEEELLNYSEEEGTGPQAGDERMRR